MTRFYASILSSARMSGLRSVFVTCCCALLGLPALVLAQATSQTFNASGTYVVPAGYTAVVKVEAWGGGAGSNNFASISGTGGGGGAYAGIDNLTLVAGSYPITVGAGGTGDGGNTFIQNPSATTLLSANGGTRGEAGGAGGTASTQPTGVTSYKGGNGSSAILTTYGTAGGGSATATGPGGNAANGGGGTGEGSGGSYPQNNAQAPGGGGAYTAGGAAGRLIITVRSSAAIPVCGTVVYVTQSGAGSQDGSSWTNAFGGTQLQTAINTAAGCGAQVWVATGTYKPTTTTDRNASFSMKPGVAIYGGFEGNEADTYDLSLRNFSTNPTILSGDIDGVPDVVTGSGSSLSITGNAGNAIHVIFNQSGLTNSAILDGFTVSGGNANGTSPNFRGGGMLNDGAGAGNFCSPTLRNCIFLHNNASSAGGGVYNRGVGANLATDIGECSPLFSNCTFTANKSGNGGAIFQEGSGSTSYTNCVFTYNRASYGGAIAYSTSATATAAHTFLTCSFTGNYAGFIGGAIQSGFSYETGTRTVSLTNCSFTDNVAGVGGGAFSNGLGLSAGNTPVFFTNCVFKNNVAHNGSTIGTGGAFQSQGGLTSQRATFTNCLLEGNRALGTADDGGGAIMIYSGTVTLLNSTLTNNQTATRGGGISVQDNTGSVSSKNTILWNNTATTANTNSLANGNGGSATVGYSLLQEAACPANVTCGAGNIYNQDPRFVNPATGNFQLAACSPAINAGTNAGAPSTDLLGNPRPLTGANPADMGAYEFQGTPGFSVSITPGGPTTFCAGGSVLLSTGSYSTYVWKKDNVQVSTDPSYSATTPGSYTVTVTDANGCSGTSSPVAVNVNPLPVVSITGLAASYCKNTAAVTLSGSPGGGSFTVDGNPATSFDPASLSAGPHAVVYSYTDPNTCSNTTSQTVTVNPLPVVSITGLEASYCKNAAAVPLSGSPAGGSFTVDGNPATSFTPASLSVGPHAVVYSYTDANTCNNTTSQTVTVNALPVVSLAALAASYCQNAPASTPGTPAGGSYSIDGGSPVASFDPASLSLGPHSVVYSYTDPATTCSASVTQSVSILTPVFTQQPSLSASLVVCANGTVSISFNVNCPGNATFTAELSDASGSFTSGTQNLGPVTPGVPNTLTIPGLTAPTSANYRIRVVGSNPTLYSDPTGIFRINALAFNSNPTVNLTAVCAGASIKVSFTLNGNCPFLPGNAFSAELSDASGSFASPLVLGSVAPGINTLTIPQSIPTGTGYRVRIRATAPALLSAQSAAFTVNQPSFASAPSVSLDNQCPGQAVRLSFSVGCAFFAGNTFTAQLSSAAGSFASPVNVGSVTAGSLNSVVIPAGTPAGTGYKLRVVSSNPVVTSTGSANFRVKACVNREVAPQETGLQVRVSPNPSPEGRLRIVVTGAEGRALRVELFNGLGQALREHAIERASDEEILSWDISRQPQGLYLLRVSTGKESKTVKILH